MSEQLDRWLAKARLLGIADLFVIDTDREELIKAKYTPSLQYLRALPPVKRIASRAFQEFVPHLIQEPIDIVIPDTVEEIGAGAFAETMIVKNITFGKNLVYIGSSAFANNPSLKEVKFSQNSKLEYIDPKAFLGCTRLEKIVIPDGVKNIGFQAFSNCPNLTYARVPDSVKTMGNYVFYNSRLVDLDVNLDIDRDIQSDTFITNPWYADQMLIKGCLISNKNCLISSSFDNISQMPKEITKFSPKCFSIKTSAIHGDIIIPERITEISEKCFYKNTNITGVYLPDTIKFIGIRAFYGCENLTNVRLPNTINMLSESLFIDCSSLKTLEIPDSVEWIDGDTLSQCGLQDIRFPKHDIYLDKHNFYNTPYAKKHREFPPNLKFVARGNYTDFIKYKIALETEDNPSKVDIRDFGFILTKYPASGVRRL